MPTKCSRTLTTRATGTNVLPLSQCGAWGRQRQQGREGGARGRQGCFDEPVDVHGEQFGGPSPWTRSSAQFSGALLALTLVVSRREGGTGRRPHARPEAGLPTAQPAALTQYRNSSPIVSQGKRASGSHGSHRDLQPSRSGCSGVTTTPP
jgi:hypothetical protein